MGKNSQYQEKQNPFLTFLYIVVTLALIAALAVMYMNDRNRLTKFDDIVREAAADERSLDIAAQKDEELLSLDANAISVPTEAPTEVPSLMEEVPTVEPVIALTTDVPGDALVDESLAQGLD